MTVTYDWRGAFDNVELKRVPAPPLEGLGDNRVPPGWPRFERHWPPTLAAWVTTAPSPRVAYLHGGDSADSVSPVPPLPL